MGLANITDADGKMVDVDDDFYSLATIDTILKSIRDGLSYIASYSLDIAGSASHYGILTTPNASRYLHLNFKFSNESEVGLSIYENVTVSSSLAGTSLTAYNKNRDSSNTSSGLLYYSPTVTNVTLGSVRLYNRHFNGSEEKETGIIKLDANKKYAFCFENFSTAANYTSYSYEWIEQ